MLFSDFNIKLLHFRDAILLLRQELKFLTFLITFFTIENYVAKFNLSYFVHFYLKVTVGH